MGLVELGTNEEEMTKHYSMYHKAGVNINGFSVVTEFILQAWILLSESQSLFPLTSSKENYTFYMWLFTPQKELWKHSNSIIRYNPMSVSRLQYNVKFSMAANLE